jgi:DNA polymerase I-like protein with 3'-5' exonuclease and polymerase domains
VPLVFDIETNGFLADLDTVHCINIYDLEKHCHERYDPDNRSILDGVKRLSEADTIIGHNIIDFDIPALQKIYPHFSPPGKVIDTYVWSACTWPDIEKLDWKLYRKDLIPASLIGTYKLEAFGYRLGVFKGAFCHDTDWQEWSPEMSDYCEQDVVVNCRLLEKLAEKGCSQEQVELETEVRKILSRQMRHGVLFDVKAAEKLFVEISTKMEKLREQIQESFPPFWKRKGKLFTPKRDIKKQAGEWRGYVAGAPMQKIEQVEFNPGSSAHISRMLMSKYGWIPEEFADKETPPAELQHHYDRLKISASTVPKIDDEILKRLPYDEAKPLAEFQMLKKRCAQLSTGNQGWLKHYDANTNRIHGVINQFGAVTGRCTHFKPNLAQVPAVYSPYGKECRSLFIVPKGYKLLGCDADGLEARCKAHYLFPFDKGAFVKVILEGKKSEGTDIHSLNRDRLGFTGKNARDTAKTWYYAFMYGAGDEKLGRTAMEDDAYKDTPVEDAAKLGGRLRKKLAKEFPGLEALIKAVRGAAKRGWLKGLDGRKIPVRSQHSALNTLLQSAGAVVMKKALEIADKGLKQAMGLVPGQDYEWVLNVHDEYQCEIREEHAEQAGKILAEAIKLAGEHFKFKCPLSGSYDIGDNWKETH